ncbi:MAG: DUF1847 domain-containing protein [Desulfobacteraceae bacterium]|nr:DUF1847 domain-containing protein [Desulfobacteraceae bacterium]
MKPNKKAASNCAACQTEIPGRICFSEKGKATKGCPTVTHKKILNTSNAEYDKNEVHHFARQASLQEAACYANRDQTPYVMQPTKTRIIEICEFAKRMEYKTLGLAFCLGLAKEALVVDDIFKQNGFDVVSICCKAGRTPKTHIGLSKEETIYQDTDESMCNPVYQAKLLNAEHVDLAVLLGLCVGHDTLFFKYCEAPVTVLAVKDRVTAHNPMAAIYTSESYYRKIKFPDLNK